MSFSSQLECTRNACFLKLCIIEQLLFCALSYLVAELTLTWCGVSALPFPRHVPNFLDAQSAKQRQQGRGQGLHDGCPPWYFARIATVAAQLSPVTPSRPSLSPVSQAPKDLSPQVIMETILLSLQ